MIFDFLQDVVCFFRHIRDFFGDRRVAHGAFLGCLGDFFHRLVHRLYGLDEILRRLVALGSECIEIICIIPISHGSFIHHIVVFGCRLVHELQQAEGPCGKILYRACDFPRQSLDLFGSIMRLFC